MSESVVPQEGVVAPAPAASTGKQAKKSPLVRGALCLVVALAAYKLIPVYYFYLDLRVSCARALRDAEIESDEEIKLKMVEAFERHGIVAVARDIQIRRGEGKISIMAPYQEDIHLNFLGTPIRVFSFSFSPSAERVYK